jgi:hypothetical protein
MILSDAGATEEDISEEIVDVLDKPVSRACKFYTLYYIDVELDIDGFDFYYNQEKDLQYDALYNYSIFACGGELKHLGKHFAIDNFKLDDILYRAEGVNHREKTQAAGQIYKSNASEYVKYLSEAIETEAPPELHSLIKQLMINNHINMTPIKDERDLVGFIKTMEHDYSAFSRHERFLRACKFIFGYDWGQKFSDMFAPALKVKPKDNPNAYGWQVQYGGDGWSNVPETALLRHDFDGEQTFIDMMWAVEHNNGNFVDKLPFIDNDEMEIVAKSFREEVKLADSRYIDIGGKITVGDIAPMYETRIMQNVLDFARSENMRPVARIAKNMYSELRDRRLRLDMFPQDELLVKELENYIRIGR